MTLFDGVSTPRPLNLLVYIVTAFFIYSMLVSLKEYLKTKKKYLVLIIVGSLLIWAGNLLTQCNFLLYFKSQLITKQQANFFQSIIVLIRLCGVGMVIPALIIVRKQKGKKDSCIKY